MYRKDCFVTKTPKRMEGLSVCILGLGLIRLRTRDGVKTISFSFKGSSGLLTVSWSNLKPIISLLPSKDLSLVSSRDFPGGTLGGQEETASGQCQLLNTL